MSDCRGCFEKKSTLAQVRTKQEAILPQPKGHDQKCRTESETTGAKNMAHFNPVDSSGKFAAPSDEAIASLDDTGRKLVDDIRIASLALDAAAAAIAVNEKAIAETEAEIAALLLIVPKQNFHDLWKGVAAETQKRRAGL
jgi:hypothetical protein